MRTFFRHSVLLALLLLIPLSGFCRSGPQCPDCLRRQKEGAEYCEKCFRGLTWPVLPPSNRFGEIVVRTGKDAFIRGPNDIHPRHPFYANAGGDPAGPVGSYYSKTGLRYLIRFDIREAFEKMGLSMREFRPEQVWLILRTVPLPDAGDRVPIVIFPLTRPFVEGDGLWGKHSREEPGCNWLRASLNIPWTRAGGDFNQSLFAEAELPRSGPGEAEIDVTNIYRPKFEECQKTGIWSDFGLIVMRNENRGANCLYRTIYSFESAPGKAVENDLKGRAPGMRHETAFPRTDANVSCLSPELIFR